jgi:hypothetical protein
LGSVLFKKKHLQVTYVLLNQELEFFKLLSYQEVEQVDLGVHLVEVEQVAY